MHSVHTKSIEVGGRSLILETGKLAPLASGAVYACYGDTVVLATAVISDPRDDIDYFPLTVEYEERLYAGGLIKGSPWVKREGRPRDEAILNARLIDRTVRPLFPKEFKNDVQVIVTVLSVDSDNDPAIVGLIAASTALQLAGVPWSGPVSGVRIGKVNGTYMVNPLLATEMAYSQLDMVVSSTEDKVLMLEVGAEEVPEAELISGIEVALGENRKVIESIKEFAHEVGTKTIEYEKPAVDEDLVDKINTFIRENFDLHANENKDKTEAHAERVAFLETLFSAFEGKATKPYMKGRFEAMRREEIRRHILQEGRRLDNRPMDVVRPLSIEIGLLPRTHGSAMFQRGDTQALTVTTLGSTSLEQLIESMTGESTKRYIHHYNFPPFATGETGRVGSPKRREIGHGALAERALEPVIPMEDQFPYTVRVVSEILSSNGSSSMASVCGSTLSLMDAGVPIKEPVAGIAMGLIDEGDKKIILTDLLGEEDMAGDMDFKVAGTKNGVTAVQVDVKNQGLEIDLIRSIFKQAHDGRMHILGEMLKVIESPRTNLSQYAPKVDVVKIDPEKIGEIIGPGGKIIKAIQADTQTVINIEEDGTVFITGIEAVGIQNARRRIEGITHEPVVGEVYEGEVKRILDFGAFVEYLPGKEGLVHISEISNDYVESVRDVLKEGDTVTVKVIEVDDRGRINLSIKKAHVE